LLDHYLIIVGAQKCGTTTLYEHLATSEYFASSKVKELHYFDNIEAPEINDYVAQFSETAGSRCYLESTPSYLYLPDAPERLNDTLAGKNVKIVVCLRDPVKRAYSHYQMNVRRQQETDSFDTAFHRMSTHPMDSYFHRGLYSEQIARYIDLFGKESVLVLEMEKDFKDTPTLNSKLNHFLGADLGLSNELPNLNSSWDFKHRWIAQLFAPRWIRRIGRAPMLKAFRANVITRVSAGKSDTPAKEKSVNMADYAQFYSAEKLTLEGMLGRELAWSSFK
jgi:hypothetical protein